MRMRRGLGQKGNGGLPPISLFLLGLLCCSTLLAQLGRVMGEQCSHLRFHTSAKVHIDFLSTDISTDRIEREAVVDEDGKLTVDFSKWKLFGPANLLSVPHLKDSTDDPAEQSELRSLGMFMKSMLWELNPEETEDTCDFTLKHADHRGFGRFVLTDLLDARAADASHTAAQGVIPQLRLPIIINEGKDGKSAAIANFKMFKDRANENSLMVTMTDRYSTYRMGFSLVWEKFVFPPSWEDKQTKKKDKKNREESSNVREELEKQLKTDLKNSIFSDQPPNYVFVAILNTKGSNNNRFSFQVDPAVWVRWLTDYTSAMILKGTVDDRAKYFDKELFLWADKLDTIKEIADGKEIYTQNLRMLCRRRLDFELHNLENFWKPRGEISQNTMEPKPLTQEQFFGSLSTCTVLRFITSDGQIDVIPPGGGFCFRDRAIDPHGQLRVDLSTWKLSHTTDVLSTASKMDSTELQEELGQKLFLNSILWEMTHWETGNTCAFTPKQRYPRGFGRFVLSQLVTEVPASNRYSERRVMHVPLIGGVTQFTEEAEARKIYADFKLAAKENSFMLKLSDTYRTSQMDFYVFWANLESPPDTQASEDLDTQLRTNIKGSFFYTTPTFISVTIIDTVDSNRFSFQVDDPASWVTWLTDFPSDLLARHVVLNGPVGDQSNEEPVIQEGDGVKVFYTPNLSTLCLKWAAVELFNLDNLLNVIAEKPKHHQQQEPMTLLNRMQFTSLIDKFMPTERFTAQTQDIAASSKRMQKKSGAAFGRRKKHKRRGGRKNRNRQNRNH